MKKKYILSIGVILVVSVFLGISFYSNVKKSRESLRYTKLGNELWDQALEKTDVTLVARAIKEYEKAIEINPKNVDAHISLGLQHSLKGDKKKAMSLWKKATEINPRSVDARWFLARAYHRLGMNAEAQKEWEKILELNPAEDIKYTVLLRLGKIKPNESKGLGIIADIHQDPELLEMWNLVKAIKKAQKE